MNRVLEEGRALMRSAASGLLGRLQDGTYTEADLELGLLIAQAIKDNKEEDMRTDELERTSAWGNVKPTKAAAITDALRQLRRLATTLHARQVGADRIEEVRKTPTGHQARVSADLRRLRDRR